MTRDLWKIEVGKISKQTVFLKLKVSSREKIPLKIERIEQDNVS